MAIYGGACGSTWIGGGRGFMKGLVIGLGNCLKNVNINERLTLEGKCDTSRWLNKITFC